MAVKQILVGKAGSSATPLTLIKGDSNTQIIEMIVERYYGGVDLAGLAWSVTAENANGATDEYRGIEGIANGTNIAVRWKTTGTATAAVGLTKFKLSGYAQDGSDVLIWQSGDYFIRVNDTFEYVPGAETQAELTEVQKLIIYVDGELNKVIKAGNDATEAAKAANKAADRANSVADGKNEGRITALEQFTTKPEEPYAVEGKLVQLDNFEGMPMNAVTRIEPVQAGSGDPYPGGGKNKLDIANAIKATNSVSDVASDGKITIKGSLPAQWSNAYIGAFNMVSGKVYTISGVLGYGRIGFSTDPSITPGNTANPNISMGSADIINCNHSVATFTANDTKTVYVWYCTDSANNGSNSAFTMGLQIEEGATASSYAPYSNIRPISGHTGAKLSRCGKNLFDKDSALLNSWYSYSPTTPDVQSWNGLFASKLIPVRPGEVFTLTNYLTDTSCALVKYLVSETDTGGLGGIRSGDVITCDGTKQIYTFAIPDRVRYIGITGDMANIDKVQLELGTAPSPFEPYQGDTFSASFGQTVYGGTLNWNTGVLTVDRAVYNFTGNEPFSLTPGGIPYFSVTKSAGVIASVVRFDQTSEENGSCSHYKPVSAWSGNACEYMGVTHSFRFTDTRFAAVDDFKAYLAEQKNAGTPVQVCHKLATPTTIQLTPAQLTALQGMNNIFCDAGETTVSGRKDILWLTSALVEQIDTLKKAIISLGGNV